MELLGSRICAKNNTNKNVKYTIFAIEFKALKNPYFAVVDVETTGGKPHLTRITEIAIYITNGIEIREEFISLINPQRPIDPFVVKLTGIDDKMVAEAPLFSDVAGKIFELLDGKIFVAHNVEFDFGMIKKEFFRCGYKMSNAKLCTVKLSKKYYPGHPSYSLGNICKQLAIQNASRHRAAGDAYATALLFHKIFELSNHEELEKDLWEGLDIKNLPSNITKEQIAGLPEAIGIIYLRDAAGKIIYIASAKNIYSGFISLLKKSMELPSKRRMLESIETIDYECFGNYLTTSLVKYDQLKQFTPEFNKRTGIRNYTHELTLEPDEWGYYQFKVNKSGESKEGFAVKTTSKKAAEKLANQLIKKNNLNLLKDQLQLYKQNHSEEMVKTYNAHFSGIFSKFQFYKPNFIVIAESLIIDASDVFLIENYDYKGMGTVGEDVLKRNNIEEIKESITPVVNNPDITLILKDNLKKSKYIIRYF